MKHTKTPLLTLALLVFLACSSTGSQPPSVTGSATSSVHIIAASDCPELTCSGPLGPGAYRTTVLDPTIDFEIASAGWTWDISAGNFRILADLSHEDLYSPEGIYFLRKPSIASQDCEETPEAGVGRSVRDIVAWLQAAPGLAISEPMPLTLGGLVGERLDLRIDPTWKRTCVWSNQLPAVPLIFRGTAIGGYGLAMLPDMSMRWYILESPSGVIIVDIEDGPGGLSRDELLPTATEIVESLAFS